MKIITKEIILQSRGNCNIIDLTDETQKILNETNLLEGSCGIFSIGSTAAVTTIEYEPGLLRDIPRILDKLIPQFSKYYHNETWGDGNGHAHIRSALIGTSLNVPFRNGMLMLGTWQQIVLIDFDNKKRTRRVAIQVTGK
ncbi:MAG: YjbQ family protein [Bacteroidetes bacterium]|nr:YjbQ family protein [Bacteroidota bacterium]